MTLETQDPHELWAQCLLNIERQVRPQSFSNWFRPTLVNRFDEDQLVIQVPSLFFADWVENHYLGMIQSAVKEETTLVPKVSFVVAQASAPDRGKALPSPAPTTAPTELALPAGDADLPGEKLKETEPAPAQHTSLNERYTFEDFVIGEGSRFAHAAALAVAKSPGKTQFNPLVIYGAVGLGKTHLLQAIGHHAQNLNLAQKVVYVPSEKFMSDFIESLKNRNTIEFQKSYRSVDILLVDDIQFLLRGEQTQNEFFHTFNVLLEANKQIIITSDRYPKEIHGLEERLKSRFGWGLAVCIDPPELETCVAILKVKASLENFDIPDEVAFFIASKIRSNVRELEGALRKLMANCRFTNREPSVALAKESLRDLLAIQAKQITIENIQKTVAEYYNIRISDLLSKRRNRSITRPRQLAMAITRDLTSHSLPEIGDSFGGRDHTTVIHACKRTALFKESNNRIKEDYENIIRSLNL